MLQARDKKKKHTISQTADCESSLPWADSFPLHICFPERERERKKHQDVRKWASHASVSAYEIMRERQHLVSPTAARRRRRNRLAAAAVATFCMMMVMMMVQELQLLMDRVWRIIFTMDCVKIPPRPRPHLPLLRMGIVCMRRSSG